MIIKKLSEVEIMDTAHKVDARNLYKKDEAMITVITLKPGQSLKRHITPVNVAFYVLEGTGLVEVGDEKIEVTKDTLVESPKDILHCWYNESSNPLRFMVVKAPKPVKKTVAKAKPVKKVAAKKTPVKKVAAKKPATKKPVKLTAIGTVLAIIERSKKGVDTASLKKKTGFKDNIIHNNVYKLKKQGKIKSAGKGVYVKA